MDVNIFQDIMIGLYLNGLSYIIGYSSGKVNNFIFEKEEFTKILIQQIDFKTIIEEMLEDQELGDLKVDDIFLFLKSPGAESIIRQIYAYRIYPLEDPYNENKASIEDIKEEFSLLLSQNIDVKEIHITDLATKLFSILLIGCEIALEKAVNKGELAAHEAEDKYRFKLLSDQIDAVRRNIDFLLGKDKPGIIDINKFVEEYRKVVKIRYETIRSASYTDIRPSIDEIYVCPNLIIKKEVKIQDEKEDSTDPISNLIQKQELISIDQLLPCLYRVVLLGDPGAGKSTFAQKISHDIVKKGSDKISPGNCDIPVIVTLRDYQIENLHSGISILDFIKKDTYSSYQIKVKNGIFEYLLLNGFILLIFDGLDELLDTRLRANIVDEIESFCTIYPSVPVLVTSRKVGYDQAPLRSEMFQKIELAPFDKKQIEEYVNKWFSLDPGLTRGEKKKKIDSFLRESKIASDISSNSLMLSLMCSIYREENYIPENRHEVYKKCSEMLFEKWDKSRGISPPLLVAKPRIKSLVSYLAFIIFTKDSLQKGIHENELISKIKEFLLEKLYENEDDAEEAAKDFIHFCKGRAWVLSDTGTTKIGENIYQFTHRTFLEYFTAEWIERKYGKDLCEILLPRICMGEWDNVSQLAFQLRYEKSEYGDELFSELIQKLDEVVSKEKFNLLSFASRCLGFIVPSPKTAREITIACFNYVIKFKYELFDKNVTEKVNFREPMELIYALENSLPENRKVIGDTIENAIIENVCKDTRDEAVLSFEICLILGRMLGRFSEYDTFRTKNLEFWEKVKTNIIEKCSSHTHELIKRKLSLCIELYRLNRISLKEVIDLHGFSSIFCDYYQTIVPRTRFIGIYYSMLTCWLSNKLINMKDFEDFGRTALKSVYPMTFPYNIGITLVKKEISIENILERKSNFILKVTYKNIPQVISLNQINDSIFGVFCLLAYFFEKLIKDYEVSVNINESFLEEIMPITGFLKTIFESRIGKCNFDALKDELNKIKFTDEQIRFIEKWVKQETYIWDFKGRVEK
jgi:GTPase SAR1 family protein